MNIAARIIILVLAAFGVYKMFPQIAEPVDFYIKDPNFQNSAIIPAVRTANKVLPSKLQIPEPDVLGAQTSAITDSPLKSISDVVTQQVASIAAEQVVNIKKAASDQFCQALIEKIKTECGQ
jgi:hypothetical protein